LSAQTSTNSDKTSYGLSLSQEEVQRLMEATSEGTLVAVTEKIAGAYNQRSLESADTKAAEQIFRLLVRETELQVRLTLAEQLKNSASIPRDIVMTLAQDVAEVALPILQFSEVLTDHDLLDLIDNTEDVNRYLAISRRGRVSETVSESLLEKDKDEVALALVDNAGAAIAPKVLTELIAKKPGNASLMEALSQRPQLPITVVEKLINVVSNSMGESLKRKYSVPDKALASEVEKTRESETLKLIAMAGSQEEITKLVEQLLAFGRLSPSLILSTLCQGNFRFFETGLARLANVPVANARTLINDHGDLGFRAIYNKSGLSGSLFPAVRLLLKVVHALDMAGEKTTAPGYANRAIDELLKQSAATPVENLSYIVALMRQAAQ